MEDVVRFFLKANSSNKFREFHNTEKMLESRLEDALVKLVKTAETLETVGIHEKKDFCSGDGCLGNKKIAENLA